MVRRRVRRRRGCCAACGYDLSGAGAGGGVCPECGGGSVSRSRRRPALRLVTRAALFALIGAAVTVLVAWGCSVSLGSTYLNERLMNKRLPFVDASGDPLPPARWKFAVPPGWPEVGRPDWYAAAPGVSIEEWSVKLPHAWWEAEWVKTGIPMRALSASRGIARRFPDYAERGFEHGLIASDQSSFHLSLRDWLAKPRLAVHPLWPGFLVDTAFYGGLAFIAWGAPGLVRRRVRRGRGRCAACGYDLSGAGGASGGVCPECGGGGA